MIIWFKYKYAKQDKQMTFILQRTLNQHLQLGKTYT